MLFVFGNMQQSNCHDPPAIHFFFLQNGSLIIVLYICVSLYVVIILSMHASYIIIFYCMLLLQCWRESLKDRRPFQSPGQDNVIDVKAGETIKGIFTCGQHNVYEMLNIIYIYIFFFVLLCYYAIHFFFFIYFFFFFFLIYVFCFVDVLMKKAYVYFNFSFILRKLLLAFTFDVKAGDKGTP